MPTALLGDPWEIRKEPEWEVCGLQTVGKIAGGNKVTKERNQEQLSKTRRGERQPEIRGKRFCEEGRVALFGFGWMENVQKIGLPHVFLKTKPVWYMIYNFYSVLLSIIKNISFENTICNDYIIF